MTEYGYIVLANSKKALDARLIKFVTKSKWSHSFITVPYILGEQMCLEAAASGVSILPFTNAYRNDPTQGYEIYRVKVSQELKDKAVLGCLTDLEVGYGFMQLPWFMYRGILGLANIDIKHQSNWSKQGRICSQEVDMYLDLCGLSHLFMAYGEGSLAPQDLYNVIKANPDIFELVEVKE